MEENPEILQESKSEDTLSLEPEPMGTCAITPIFQVQATTFGSCGAGGRNGCNKMNKEIDKNMQKEEFSIIKRTNKARMKMHRANKRKPIYV